MIAFRIQPARISGWFIENFCRVVGAGGRICFAFRAAPCMMGQDAHYVAVQEKQASILLSFEIEIEIAQESIRELPLSLCS
jgi:hypothetical protein